MAAAAGPGKPTAARLVNQGANLWAMDSFTSDESYLVDLNAGTCSCKGFKYRGACKHVEACRGQRRWLKAVEKARQCSDADLLKLGQKYLGDEVISGAIITVQHERRRQAKADHDLKEMFS